MVDICSHLSLTVKEEQMKKFVLSVVAALAVVAISAPAFATNGTNIIGVGAISRSMGGVGAAAPQDAISAVFANPAAMCYIPCETSEVDFAATIFVPKIDGSVSLTGGFPPPGGFSMGVLNAESEGQPYAFPAIGIYTPINDKWRFGLAAYGVSGLGVDYKDTGLEPFGVRTQLAIMKFAPNVAYMINPNLSVGAAFQLNWAQLDLGDGDSHDFGFGTQVGALYKRDAFSMGVTYQSPQNHEFERISDFDGNGVRDNLDLEQPQQVVLGLAYDIIPNTLLVEVDGKWLNWSDAKGYKDFDWEDQYVISVGTQYKPVEWLAVRAGYNYGNNPVKEHNGWDADMTTAFGFPGGSGSSQNVQGVNVNRFQYEFLRTIGFPAIVEHHVTCGLGINITPKVSLNAGYMHAFANTISETSAAEADGTVVNLKSKLSEDSYEFGLNIMF